MHYTQPLGGAITCPAVAPARSSTRLSDACARPSRALTHRSPSPIQPSSTWIMLQHQTPNTPTRWAQIHDVQERCVRCVSAPPSCLSRSRRCVSCCFNLGRGTTQLCMALHTAGGCAGLVRVRRHRSRLMRGPSWDWERGQDRVQCWVGTAGRERLSVRTATRLASRTEPACHVSCHELEFGCESGARVGRSCDLCPDE
jgi:hypothetical protein